MLLPLLPRPDLVPRGATIATYAQWRAAADLGDIRRVTWVCGDQRVLVEEVVDTTRRLLGVSDLDYVSLSHSPTFDRDVWAAANQYPLNPGGNRLVLVRDAEKLKRWDQFALWQERTRQMPGAHLLFVSNETTLPYVNGRQGALAPHAQSIRSPRGFLVKCSMPRPDDAVAWVRRRAPTLDEDTARHLLTRTGGDLATAAAVCAKVSLFTGPAGPATVDQLCAERPSADLADHLLAGEKRRALLCVPELDEQEMHRITALLDTRLDLLQSLHRLQAAGQNWRDATGINSYLLRKYMPLARDYDPQRCGQRRRVLAVVDDALRSGARVGVFEGLIATW